MLLRQATLLLRLGMLDCHMQCTELATLLSPCMGFADQAIRQFFRAELPCNICALLALITLQCNADTAAP